MSPPSICLLCQSGGRKAALSCIEGAKRPKCALARDMIIGCEKWKASFTSVLPEHMNTLDFDVFRMCSALDAVYDVLNVFSEHMNTL